MYLPLLTQLAPPIFMKIPSWALEDTFVGR